MGLAPQFRCLPAVLVAALLGVVVVAGGCNCIPGCNDQVDDAKARHDYYEQAAKTYYDGGRYADAVRMWDKVLEENPDDQWAKFGLAKSLHMVGEVRSLRRAEAILVCILKLDWTHPTRGCVLYEVETTLASVYSDLADFYDRDIRILDNRLANDPNANSAELTRNIQRQKCMRDDLLRKSIPLWQKVLCANPDNPRALAGLAKANLMIGNEGTGIHYAERYVNLTRESQMRWRRKLREWQCQKKGDVSREQHDFFMQKIQGAREKEKGMQLLLGSVHMRREEYPQAIKRFDAVLALDPATPAAFLERAQARAGMGAYRPAVDDLEQYLKMTDPQKQRKPRIEAAELLDRYRRIVGRESTAAYQPPPARSGYTPSSIEAQGSPDG